METLDLFEMRANCIRQRVMLCFNGPISRSLIEEIGHALRKYLEDAEASPGGAMDVFAVYVEMTQNIRHYASKMNYSEADGAATVVVSRDEQGRYMISVGNLVEAPDAERLVQRIDQLAAMDKAQLKAAYKEQLRRPRDAQSPSGAGLGLLDMARRSSEPLQATLRPMSDGRSFFCLRAVFANA